MGFRDNNRARPSVGVLATVESRVLLATGASLLVLVPFRGFMEGYPLAPFLGALTVFMAPGVLLAHWLFREAFYGISLLPAGLVFSSSVFGLAAVPFLVAHGSLDAYLVLCGTVAAGSLAVACGLVLAGRATGSIATAATDATTVRRWLRLLFVLLGAAVALGPSLGLPLLDGDTWVYVAHVREHLNAERLAVRDPYFGTPLAPISRVKINGWLLEEAGLSRLSGIDPLELIMRYLAPALSILALLSFHALARTLFRSETVALFAGSLYALFLLAYLEPTTLSFGGEFVGRVAQDKFAARFLFLPLAIAFAGLYVRRPSCRYRVGFVLICWGVVAVHPIGLAIIGLCVAGFGLLYVALNWRESGAWFRIGVLGSAVCSVAVIPAAFAILSGEPLSSLRYAADIGGTEPQVLANQVFVRDEWRHILVLEGGRYIMHPYLVETPVILAGYLLGVPFLASRLMRNRRDVTASLLLGSLGLATVVSFVPPVATFVGERVVGAGQLWRLAWPIPSLVVLTLTWIGWEFARWLRFSSPGRLREAGVFLPVAVVICLAAIIMPVAGARLLADYEPEESGRQTSSCFDPFFDWLRKNVDEPGVILAPAYESQCVPAYSAKTNVVSLRGPSVLDHLPELERFAGRKIEVPQHMRDVRSFFRDATPEERVRILRRYRVDYVLVFRHSPTAVWISNSPGFHRLDTPGDRYVLYAVHLR